VSESETVLLEERWRRAMQARQGGDHGEARTLLSEILHTEPRLAEPRLELALLDTEAGRHEDAAEHVTLAIGILERGGQWVDDLEPHQLTSFAYNLLGEIRYSQAEAIATAPDRDRFHRLWNQAADAFATAYELDPENPDAKRNAAHVRRVEN